MVHMVVWSYMRRHAQCLASLAPLLFACAAAHAVAQELDAPRADRMFMQSIADAVRRQPDFESQVASVRQARGSLSEARSGFLPRVQLLVDSGEDRSLRGGRAESMPDARGAGEINPQLSLTQLLFDGGAAWNRTRAARDRLHSAASGVDAVANNLALLGVQIHLTVVRQRDAVQIAMENLERVGSVRDKVAGRVEEGRDPRSELSRLDSRVLEARAQLADAQRDLQEAEASYEEFFGVVPAELHAPLGWPPRRARVEEAIEHARTGSAELLALREELDASGAELRSTRAAMLWPVLSLQVSGTAYDALGNAGLRNRDTYVGLRVSYDAFSGGAALARTQQASGRQRIAQLAVRKAELALDRRLRQAYSAVEARELQATTMADRVERDRGAIDDYEQLFLAGRRSLNDLIVAQRDYFSSAMQFLDVQQDLQLQRHAVAALTGELAAYFGIDTAQGRP